ncbi:MAG: hypothetical protein ABGX16_10780 [Pirellulales bacterium]
MGQDHGTLNQSGSARSDRRLQPRACLRKGCAQTYQPLRWNQRYCQDPDCLRALRRWQAAQRQREHRRSPKNRQRHASAEAARREQRRKTSETIGQEKTFVPQTLAARCHAAKTILKIYAVALDVMKRPASPIEHPLAIVEMIAARQSGVCAIANVSG